MKGLTLGFTGSIPAVGDTKPAPSDSKGPVKVPRRYDNVQRGSSPKIGALLPGKGGGAVMPGLGWGLAGGVGGVFVFDAAFSRRAPCVGVGVEGQDDTGQGG